MWPADVRFWDWAIPKSKWMLASAVLLLVYLSSPSREVMAEIFMRPCEEEGLIGQCLRYTTVTSKRRSARRSAAL